MNKTYRLIWNELTNSWVAVSEITKARGKRASGALLLASTLAAAIPVPTFAQAPPAATALPSGGQVVAGTASINQNAAVMSITQSTQNVAIDWQTFNVGSSAAVNFIQPSSNAVALNRVITGNPSQIFGQINANGQVFLTNPGGIYFAPGASVNVGALVATTHGISNADFMAGNYTFTRDGSTGSVINEGNLTANLGGYIALLAPEVRNNGIVIAQMGSVALAAGDLIELQMSSNHTLADIRVAPSTIAALVENGNAVQAPGGMIILSAQAAAMLQGGVVRNTGTLEASSLVERGGVIRLEGDHITLASSSKIAATGATGGGTVLVGGDWQGSNGVYQATTVTMEQGASIDASATQNGDGGKVVLWSDITNANSQTRAYGTFFAKGGPDGGDGGQIETSGHWLDVVGITANASASNGNSGVWLLDPYNVTIGSSVSGTAYASNYIPGADSTILASAIATSLQGGTSVTITTGSSGSSIGDITVVSAITKNSGNTDVTLTLRAANSIVVNQAITNSGGTGKLNVVLDADNNAGVGDGGGVVMLNNNITTNGGSLSFGTGRTASLGGVTTLVGGDVFVGGSGALTLSTNGGAVDVKGEMIIANTAGLTVNSNGGNVRFYGLLNSGNSYASVAHLGGTWASARTSAASGTGGGVGDTYLATITSRLENSVTTIVAGNSGAWLGAQRDLNNANATAANTWYWVTGPEGLMNAGKGLDFFQQDSLTAIGGRFNNFAFPEPNGTTSTGESALQFFGTLGQWNDLSATIAPATTGAYGITQYIKETNLAVSPLTVSAGVGTVTFSGAVGGNKALSALSVTAATTAINGGGVTTAGAQTYTSNITLGNTSTTLTQTNANTDFTLGANRSITNATNVDASLTIKTTGNILMDSGSSISSSTGKLNTVLRADTDANGGNISLNSSSITTNGGHLWMGGGAQLGTLWNGLTVGSGAAKGVQGINIWNSSNINTGSGNIYMNGESTASGDFAIGLRFFGAQISGNNIELNGVGSAVSTGIRNWGISFENSQMNGSGALNLTGVGGGAVSSGIENHGIYVSSDSVLSATGSGTFTLHGTGGTGTGSGDGVLIDKTVQSVSGSIQITGIKGTGASVYGINIDGRGTGNGNVTSTSAGNITLITDTLNVLTGGKVQSSGALNLDVYTTGTTIGIGGEAGTLQLASNLFSTNFTNGFSNITIGSTTAGNILLAGATTYNDPLTFKTAGNIGILANITSASVNSLTLTAAGNVVVDSNINLGGALNVQPTGNFVMGANLSNGVGATILAGGGFTKTGTGTSYLTGSITTSGQAINIAGPVQVGSFDGTNNPVSLSSGGGAITLPGAVSAFSGTNLQSYAAVIAQNMFGGAIASGTGSANTMSITFGTAGNWSFIPLWGMSSAVDYLVIGGGGGGGQTVPNYSGGGGGAGGVATGSMTMTGGTLYSMTIGAAGAVGNNPYGANIDGSGTGGDTSFNGTVSGGGGAGGGYWGGSGAAGRGGAGYTAGGGGGGAGGNANGSAQGYGGLGGTGTQRSGGKGSWNWGNSGGAGGGSNAASIDTVTFTGTTSSITGASVIYGVGAGGWAGSISNWGGGGTTLGSGGSYGGVSGGVILGFTGSNNASTGKFSINSGAGAVTLGSTVTNLSNLTINAGGAASIAGIMSGTGSLTKAGTGALTLTQQNTFTGGTTVDAGTLVLNDVTNNSYGVILGTLTVNAAGTVQLTGSAGTLGWDTTRRVTTLNINGGMVEAINGRQVIWNLTGGLNFDGGGTLRSNGGTSNAAATSYLEIANNNITVSNPTAQAEIAGRVDLRYVNGDHIFTVADGAVPNDLLISAAITSVVNNINFTKAGAGKLTLTGTNSYTGGITTISAGTLQVGAAGTSGTLGTAGVTNNASLVFDRSDAVTVSNAISGTGSVTKLNTNTLTLSGGNSYSGGTTLSAGVIKLGASNALGTGTATVADGAALDLNGLNAANALSVIGTGVSSGGVVYNSATTVGTASGAITLTGDSTFKTSATGGLTIGSVNGAYGLTVNTGTTAFTQSGIVGGTTAPTSYTVNAGTTTISAAVKAAGPISISGSTVNLNANLTSTLSGAGISALSTGYIVIDIAANNAATGTVTLTTNGGAVLLASDTDSASSPGGNIRSEEALTITTSGGAITLGGGNTSGTGFALGSTTPTYDPYFGIRLKGAVSFDSGGGDISLKGKSHTSAGSLYGAWGVGIDNSATTINSGTGKIYIEGISQNTSGAYAQGVTLSGYSGSVGTALTITSANTTADAIKIIGDASASASGTTSGLEIHSNVSSITATGGGGITLQGKRGAGTDDIYFAGGNILANGGAITVSGQSVGGKLNLNAATFGKKASTTVLSSASNITLTGDVVTLGSASAVDTSGALTVQPYSTSFTSALTWPMTNLTLANTVSGLTLGKDGNTANITVSSATSIVGPITIYGGAVTLNAGLTTTDATTGNIAITTSGLSGSGNMALANGRTLTVTQSGNSIYNGAISGTGASFTKAGLGDLGLGGASTYTGATTVDGGVLSLVAADRIADVSALTVNASGTFSLNGFSETVGSITGSGLIVNGAVVRDGLVLWLDAGNTASYNGSGNTWYDLSGNAYNATLYGSPIYNAGTSLFSFTANTQYAQIGALPANFLGSTPAGVTVFTVADFKNAEIWERVVDLGNGSPNNNIILSRFDNTARLNWEIYNGTSGATENKTGSNTAIINNTKMSYAGTADGSNLRVFANGVLNTTTASTALPAAVERLNNYIGKSNWTGDATFRGDIGTVMVYNRALSAAEITKNHQLLFNRSAATLTVGGSNASTTFSGKIENGVGTLNLTKAGSGTLTLSGQNSYSGTTTVNGGTLDVSGSGTLGTAGDYAGAIINASVFKHSSSATQTLSGLISGTGELVKDGGGALTLSGANTYSGATTISGGVLKLGQTGSGSNSPLGSAAGDTTVNDGGALDLAGYTLTTAELIAIAGTGVSSSGAVYNSSSTAASWSGLTTLTADATIKSASGGALTWNGTINGAHALTVDTKGSSSNAAFTLGGVVGGSTPPTGLSIDSGTANVTLSNATTIAGPISIYGGNVNLNANLTSTASGAGILLMASGNIATANSAKTITTNNGDISLIGDSDANGVGQLDLDYTTYSAGSGNILVRGKTFSWTTGSNGPTISSTTGTFTLESSDASFGQGVDAAWFNFPSTLSGFTVGRSTNTQSVAIGSALSVAGPISIYGGDIAINAGLTATGTNTIWLYGSGNVTEGANGYVVADKLALMSGNVNLSNASNNIGTLAASGVSGLTYVDSNALTIGTVNPTGITATGNVFVATVTEDLTVSQNITTTNTSSTAVVLAAGTSASRGGDGTPTAGNILISGTPTLSAGTGGTMALYSGNITGSTGLTSLVGTGTGRFRYNTGITAAGAVSAGYTTALSTDVVNALYREQPTASVTVGNQTITYGAAVPTVSGSTTGMVNDDTPTYGVSGAVYSSANKIKAGSYTLTATGLAALGYNLSGGSNGTLTVNKLALTGSIAAGNNTYGSAFATGAVTLTNQLVSDVLTTTVSVNTTGNTSTSGYLKAASYTGIQSVTALGGADA
ncbi:MAG: autotransporter-associated beta strand repeat-containing protein, partial [Sideroxydans sp.]